MAHDTGVAVCLWFHKADALLTLHCSCQPWQSIDKLATLKLKVVASRFLPQAAYKSCNRPMLVHKLKQFDDLKLVMIGLTPFWRQGQQHWASRAIPLGALWPRLGRALQASLQPLMHPA